jgi:hypothetical protein
MKIIALYAAVAAVVLAGCDADGPEPAAPSSATPSPATPSSATPSSATPFPGTVDAVALTAHRLRIDALPQMRLLASSDGREILARAVSCALPAGASVTAIAGDGTPYSFAGSDGLAPRWLSRAPTAGERRRLVACVGTSGTLPTSQPSGRLVGARGAKLPAGIGG